MAAHKRWVQARYIASFLALVAAVATCILYNHLAASSRYGADETPAPAGMEYANGYCTMTNQSLHCSLYIVAYRALLMKTISIGLGGTATNVTIPWGGICIQREAFITVDAGMRRNKAEGLIAVMPSPGAALELAFNASTLLDLVGKLSGPQLLSTYTIQVPSGTASSIELKGVAPSTSTAYYLAVSPLDSRLYGVLHAKLFIGQETVAWERAVDGHIGSFIVPLGGVAGVNATSAYSRLIIAYSSGGGIDSAEFTVRLYSSEPLVLGLILDDGSIVRVSIPVISLGG
ncbi:hypothetical protein [Pyrodictium abyssi]|uniref:Uncharacterized protein n=1 Tax=Pyrodictium abyssi TaxID=54256 RepID=A0ABN6ZP39_9CREN|nr:hypothetical protein PABY_15360 [Pyrodictium abyssi]